MVAKKDSHTDFHNAYQIARVLVVNKGKTKKKVVDNTARNNSRQRIRMLRITGHSKDQVFLSVFFYCQR